MAGDEIEWVDLTPAPPPASDVIHNRGPHWSWWYALIALVVVAAIVVATRPSDHGRPAASASSPAPSPSSNSPSRYPASPEGPGNPSTARGTPTLSSGPALLAVPAGWDLFGRASDAVIRIQLAGGQVTVTPIPLLSSSGPASFVAGPDRVIVRPLDVLPGYDVRDGQSYEDLPSAFPNSGPALPGPDPAHLWVPGPADQTMTLVGFDGSPTGTVVTLPGSVDVGSVSSDGAGYLDFGGVGGVYDIRPSGISRITTGALLATGPTTWVTQECDAQARCTVTVINRSSGARRPLNLPVASFGNSGTISPDGTTVAVLEGDQSQPVRLHLINLNSGADRATDVALDPNLNYQDGLFVWSPDSAWVFATNGTGRIYAVDAHTNQTRDLGLTLGPVSQLVLRVATR